ncbi:MAG: hypothetical protein Q9163_001101 [Psora crenata]
MVNAKRWALALTALLSYRTFVSAVVEVKVQGSNFVNNVTSNRFQIIGVAYQPGGSAAYGMGSDPLSNGTLCLRDAALMQSLGVNTIRIYNLDPTLDHDMCVSIFNAVGIYMLIDVNSPLPNESLNPGDLSGSYSSTYLNHIFAVVEAFHNYPNILGFFSGNEVMNNVPSGGTVPPYIRAVTRDLNDYIAKHSPKQIPVGYSAADVKDILTDSWAYLSCAINGQASDPSRIAFFGLNSYSWCGPTSPSANYVASSYDKLVEDFSNTTIPIFFSEYGCNKVEPRVFDEVPVLYGNMTSVMSGGLVYEYYQQIANNFGLVWLYDNGTAQIKVDYDNLQSQYNKLDITTLQKGNMSAITIQPAHCSDDLIQSAQFSTSFMLPSVPDGGQDLIDNGVKNPNNGKLISVTQTSVSLPVFGSNGGQLKNLAIKPLADNESNTPNGQDTSGSTTSGSITASVAQPSPTNKNSCSRVKGSLAFAGIVAFAAILL